MSEELKHCPFCASRCATVTVDDLDGWPVVICDDCGAQGPRVHPDQQKAADAWNRRARPASGEREGEIQKESANEDSETVVRMELQGSQQRIVSARPKLVADHVAAVPQDVPLRADRGEAVTPAPSLPSQAENVVPMHKVPPMYKIIDGKRIDLISEDDPAFVLADEPKGDE